ncbi:hypothetical protein Pla108_19000 [Botrimarina colliarenosi]|uniref:Uncharacterized protein n=1 Tax=Botrimarina colliarenosi TaxID=2528001 RepID=A0A5C6AEK3_9BACT|nr:PEP-CTERM sorting domain-containing protein [Botrimarina colliarenosi]TWT97748.1 hypothetical protein Pla108_19000 [Botrimarina colliarenosi]
MIRTLVALTLFAAAPWAQGATVTVADSTGPWQGYMNVSELPENGGGFVFGNSWGVPDLVANFDDGAGTLALSPNTIGDVNEFWYQNTTGTAADPTNPGGPGQRGNKVMEANLYIEVGDDSLAGQTVTFEGTVLSNTYTAAHSASIFIRDFAPDYSSSNDIFVPVSPGPFSVSLVTDPGLGRHVQYGFQSKGENVWVTDTAPFGSVVIGTVGVVPEPTTAAIVGMLGLAGFATKRRR